MTDAIDIYRAAKLVIDQHGEEAALYAAARTAVLAGEGDIEGAAVWRQITAAVEELQRERHPQLVFGRPRPIRNERPLF
jgi:hypothetical protein